MVTFESLAMATMAISLDVSTQYTNVMDARQTMMDARQQQPWWLLLSANWRVWNTATSAAISIQCCCLIGVLSKEVRTRNAAPSRTSLAEGSRENPISFMCSCPPLPSWQCATVAPYLAETLHVWRWITPLSQVWVDIDMIAKASCFTFSLQCRHVQFSWALWGLCL